MWRLASTLAEAAAFDVAAMDALADVATSLFALFDMALRVEAEIQGVDPHMVPHLLVKDST